MWENIVSLHCWYSCAIPWLRLSYMSSFNLDHSDSWNITLVINLQFARGVSPNPCLCSIIFLLQVKNTQLAPVTLAVKTYSMWSGNCMDKRWLLHLDKKMISGEDCCATPLPSSGFPLSSIWGVQREVKRQTVMVDQCTDRLIIAFPPSFPRSGFSTQVMTSIRFTSFEVDVCGNNPWPQLWWSCRRMSWSKWIWA